MRIVRHYVDAAGKTVKTGAHLANARAVHIAQAEARNANVRPIINEIRGAGVDTLKAIAQALNARGVKTARGDAWSASQVSRVLAA